MADEIDQIAARMREAAGKATPGPWYYRPHEYDDWGWIRGPKDADERGPDFPGWTVCCAKAGGPAGTEELDRARVEGRDPYGHNAAHIAASNPANVLALCAELERVTKLQAQTCKDFNTLLADGAEKADVLAKTEAELACRDALIKDHLLTILQKENRIDALDFELTSARKSGEDLARMLVDQESLADQQHAELSGRLAQAERERDEARAEIADIEASLVAAGQYRIVGDDSTRAQRIADLDSDYNRMHKEKIDAIYGPGGHASLAELLKKAGEVLDPFATFGRGDGLIPSDLARDRICDWFGTSDFDAARSILAEIEAALETRKGPAAEAAGQG